jgi:hypothetical protein
MLTGLTRPQQILFFMENNKEGIYSTNYISQWICNNFDLTGKNPTSRGMLTQINNEVSSNFTKFTEPKYKTNHKLNFEQHPQENGAFFYSYKRNKKLKLPTPVEIVAPNPYETKNILKPTQTSFNFEQNEEIDTTEAPLEETTIMDENSPLFEDIIAADKINDPIQQIIDIYNNINLHNIDDFNISTIRDNKKITIGISNL